MAAACALVGKLADVRTVASAAHVSPAKASPKITIEDPTLDDILTDDEDLDRILDQPEDGTNAGAETDVPTPSGGMVKFTQLRGIAAPMERTNVDTDAIIPKQFLKTIKRSGLGSALFYQWRYDSETGKENPDFILNKEPYRNSKFLVVTGANFGCGSSREHAPWALLDFGIRCIIAPSFVSPHSQPIVAQLLPPFFSWMLTRKRKADIHETNLYKNGMLPLIMKPEALERVAVEARAGREIEVDLPAQVVKTADGKELGTFEMESFRKHCLVNGLDDIGLTTQMEDKIRDFERRRTQNTPWLDGTGYLKRKGPVMVEAAPVPKTNRGEVKMEPLEW